MKLREIIIFAERQWYAGMGIDGADHRWKIEELIDLAATGIAIQWVGVEEPIGFAESVKHKPHDS